MGSWLDLDLDSVALLGLGAGAVVALVPHLTAGQRLAGFALGVVLALVGYVLRAGVLPDTAGGRAVFAAIIVALCVLVTAVSLERLALWSTLLGAATFAGAFEAVYNVAPPRVVENSMDTLTALALCVAVGFCAAVVGAPLGDRGTTTSKTKATTKTHSSNHEVLEDAK